MVELASGGRVAAAAPQRFKNAVDVCNHAYGRARRTW